MSCTLNIIFGFFFFGRRDRLEREREGGREGERGGEGGRERERGERERGERGRERWVREREKERWG